MNKKDVDEIGLILSQSRSLDEIRERLFMLDDRIRDEYEAYEYTQGRNDEVDRLLDQILTERYGPHWALRKEKPPVADVLEEARRQVYGEDYDTVFT